MTILIANWKMHGDAGLAENLLSSIAVLDHQGVDIGLMVPFPYLSMAQNKLKHTKISWGAQAMSSELKGAYTGDVSVSMLQDFGCKQVIVGHSERRKHWFESDLSIAQQAAVAILHDLVPIICVGESKASRDSGKYMEDIESQVKIIIEQLKLSQAVGKFIIAYEPVWAIGSGESASLGQVVEVHQAIRRCLLHLALEFSNNCIIIYGGSVNSSNLSELLSASEIEGFLVGGASLNTESFIDMVNVCKV